MAQWLGILAKTTGGVKRYLINLMMGAPSNCREPGDKKIPNMSHSEKITHLHRFLKF